MSLPRTKKSLKKEEKKRKKKKKKKKDYAGVPRGRQPWKPASSEMVFPGRHFMNDSGFQINKDGTRNVLSQHQFH